MNTATNTVPNEKFSMVSNERGLQAAFNHLQIVAFYAPEDGYLELRSFSDKGRDGQSSRRWIPVKADENERRLAVEWAAAQSAQGRGVFIGYNARTGRLGKKEGVRQVSAAYVDLDLEKRNIPRDAAMKRIETAPAPPDLVIDSGRGLHVIYFFEPTEDKAAWRALQARLADYFAMVGADNSLLTDEARVLRMTPFANQKEEVPRPTSIVRFSPLEEARRLEDIAALYGPLAEGARTEGPGGQRRLAPIVEDGGRNDFLFREGCALRQRGYESEEIEAALLRLNDGRCQPPLDENEVSEIATSASRYEPGEALLRGMQRELPEGELFTSWSVMSRTAYETPEYLVYGLCRGDVGMIQAVTNVGKSTLLRNLAVSLAFGGEFMTLAEESTPRRVMLLDYETAQARYVDDLRRMTASLSDEEQSLVKENLWSYVGKARGVPYLNLTEPEHFRRLMAEAEKFRPDLIIVDTLTAGFSVQNENDNGEVTNKVMKPLTSLAVEADAAVLFAHHIGKAGSEEGGAANRSYRARGASTFEGMSAAAIQLDVKKGPAGERVLVMGYTKVKDEEKPDLVLELNRETRWFEVSEGATALDAVDENYHRLVSLVTGPMEARQIEEAAYFVSSATRKRYLKRAVREGRLQQPRRGLYQPGCFSLGEGEEI